MIHACKETEYTKGDTTYVHSWIFTYSLRKDIQKPGRKQLPLGRVNKHQGRRKIYVLMKSLNTA